MIIRNRLIQTLFDSFSNAISTSIFAPKGYGKSTLLAQFIECLPNLINFSDQEKTDPSQNDASGRLGIVSIELSTLSELSRGVATEHELQPAIDEALDSMHWIPCETACPLKPIIIIDNCHLLESKLATQQTVDFIESYITSRILSVDNHAKKITNPATSTHFIFSGDYSPFPDAFFSERDQTQISLHDLAFQQDEMAELLAISSTSATDICLSKVIVSTGPSLRMDHVTPNGNNGINGKNNSGNIHHSHEKQAEIVESAQGWPAVIALLKQHPATLHSDLLFHTLNYFFTTLLDDTTSDVEQKLLLRISLFPAISSSLHLSIYGHPLDQRLIQRLMQKGLIHEEPALLPLLSEPSYTIINPLLQKHLQQHAFEQHPTWLSLIAPALDYYLDHNALATAVELMISHQNFNKALYIITDNQSYFNEPKKWTLLAKWFQKTPLFLLNAHKALRQLDAWDYIDSMTQKHPPQRTAKIPKMVSSIGIHRQTTQSDDQSAHCSATRFKPTPLTHQAEEKGPAQTDSQQLPLEHHHPFERMERLGAKRLTKRVENAVHLITHQSLKEAIPELNQVLSEAIAQHHIHHTFNLLMITALTCYQTGEQLLLQDMIGRTQTWIDTNQFSEHPLSIWIEGARFMEQLEAGKLSQCARINRRLKQSATQLDSPLFSYFAHYFSAHLAISLNETQQAWIELHNAEMAITDKNQPLLNVIASTLDLKWMLILGRKKLHQSQAIFGKQMFEPATTSQNLPTEKPLPLQQQLTQSALELLTHPESANAKAVNKVLQQAKKQNMQRVVMIGQLLLAIAQFRDHKHKPARKHFLNACLLSSQHGYQRTLLNFGIYTHYLLWISTASSTASEKSSSASRIKASSTDSQPEEEKILSALMTLSDAEPASKQINPLLTTLSKREREILKLVAHGKSNDEIAQELFRSVGTIKLHLHNTFQKLNIKKRSQAVELHQLYSFD